MISGLSGRNYEDKLKELKEKKNLYWHAKNLRLSMVLMMLGVKHGLI